MKSRSQRTTRFSSQNYTNINSYKEPQNINEFRGHWSQQENLTYLRFLQYMQANTSQWRNLKPKDMFISMNEFMGGHRGVQNCRSHHQHYLKKCQNIEGIIKYMKSTLEGAEKKEYCLENLRTTTNDRIHDVKESKIEDTIAEEDDQPTVNIQPESPPLPFSVINGQVYF